MRHQITKALPKRYRVAVGVNVLLFRDNKYLLLRRANTGWADGYYTVPAGHLEPGEPLTSAAIRETKEEVGVDISPHNLKLVHVMHRSDKEDDQERLDFYFLTTEWVGEPYIAETEKADSLDWFAADTLPEQTLENVRNTIISYSLELLSEVNW